MWVRMDPFDENRYILLPGLLKHSNKLKGKAKRERIEIVGKNRRERMRIESNSIISNSRIVLMV